jgi:hypothetical protein
MFYLNLIHYNLLIGKAKFIHMYFVNAKNKRGKSTVLTILFLLSIFLFYYCKKENPEPRNYPRVKGMTVSEISTSGVTFEADLYSLGTDPVIQHGFVWDLYEPDVKQTNRVLLGNSVTMGLFNARIYSTLVSGQNYTVKPFVQTSKNIVYGTSVTFKSFGSDGPIITGFEPHSARWMDTLMIKGKHFSYLPLENHVKLNKNECWVASATDTTLKVVVSSELVDLKSVLSVDLDGYIAIAQPDSFRLIVPVVNDFFPKEARWNDTLKISGAGMQNGNMTNTVVVTVGGFPCNIFAKKNGSIVCTVPEEVTALSNSVSVKINNLNYPLTSKLTMLSPVLNSISPKSGTWGTTVTLKGIFHPNKARNNITFGGILAPIISNCKDSIKVTAPQTLSVHNNIVIDGNGVFTVTAADTFKLLPPKIEMVTPLSGPSNSTVVIQGNYLYNKNGLTTVKFGTATSQIKSITGTSITCIVPPNIANGPVDITVSALSQSSVFSDKFQISNPVITNVYPLTGTFNDEITIEGQNLTYGQSLITAYFGTTGSVGGMFAEIVSSAENKLVIKVPTSLDSIPKKLCVSLLNNIAYSTPNFVLSPPVVTTITPNLVVNGGQQITISGSNFNPVPSLNKAYYDIYPLTITGSSSTELVATLPAQLPRGTVKVKVIVGGYTRNSSGDLTIQSPWLRIAAPALETWIWQNSTFDQMTIYGEGMNNYGYLCSPGSNLMYEFEPLGKTFTKLTTTSPFNGKLKMGEVVCRDTFYLIGGANGSYINGFNKITNNWRSIPLPSSMPIRSGFAFALSNKIYYGYSYNNTNRQVWQCDPSNHYVWTRKTDVPATNAYAYSTYFSIADKGYVIFADNTVLSYDPVLDSWTRKANFPGPPRVLAISFVIGDVAYYGTGSLSGISYNDIWKYNSLTDSWTFVINMPGLRNSSVAFSLNGKGYVGYGLNMYSTLYDFYEFDPSY